MRKAGWRHPANRVAQYLDLRHDRSEPRSSRFTVKKKVPPEPDCGDNLASRKYTRLPNGGMRSAFPPYACSTI